MFFLYQINDESSCQISDLEVIAIAQGLIKIQKLEYFSLKIIQKLNISEECLEKFTFAISKLKNLSRFDLYFRKYSSDLI